MGIRSLDEGQYTCIATNKVGKAETSFKLKCSEQGQKDQPKFTQQLQVHNILKDNMYTVINIQSIFNI